MPHASANELNQLDRIVPLPCIWQVEFESRVLDEGFRERCAGSIKPARNLADIRLYR